MFCPKCGTKCADDAKFCKGCGAPIGADAPVSASSQENPVVLPGTHSAYSNAGYSSFWSGRNAIVVGAGVAVIVAIALTSLFVFPGFLNNGLRFGTDSASQTVHYGDAQTVRVAKDTLIKPQSPDGAELEGYTVRLVPLSDEDYWTSHTCHVEGSGGFTLEGLGFNLSSGTYACSITPDASSSSETSTANGQVYSLPLLDYDAGSMDSSGASSEDESSARVAELTVAAFEGDSSGIEASGQTAYSLYMDKCVEYAAEYGQPTFVSGDSAAGTLYDAFDHLEGFCFAKLVDFDGDGVEELITAYYIEGDVDVPDDALGDAANADYITGHYVVELWTCRGGSLERLYCRQAYKANNGGLCSVALGNEDGAPRLVSGGGSQNSFMVYGFSGDEFGLVHEANEVYGEQSFTLDGQAVDGDAYLAFEDGIADSDANYCLSGDGSIAVAVYESVPDVIDALSGKLQGAASASNDDAAEDTTELSEDELGVLEDLSLTFVSASQTSIGNPAQGEWVCVPGWDGQTDRELIGQLVYTNKVSTGRLGSGKNPYNLDYSKQGNAYFVPTETARLIIASYYGVCPDNLDYLQSSLFAAQEGGWSFTSADGPFGRAVEVSNVTVRGGIVEFDSAVYYEDGLDSEMVYNFHVVAERDEASIFGFHLKSLRCTGNATVPDGTVAAAAYSAEYA